MSVSQRSLVCFSHLRWDFVWQRPQHLLSRAASDFDVMFIEEPEFRDGIRSHIRWRTEPSGVRVGVPTLPTSAQPSAATLMQRKLVAAAIGGQRSPVLWYYTPMALPFSRKLVADARVYDNMDELSAFRGASPRLLSLERQLFEMSDLVFVGGQSLYEAKQARHANMHCFPSSIDVKHFGKARLALEVPGDQKQIPHPRLGFFGVIDERFDASLLAQAARLRPDWHFVMIGPVVKIDPADLPRLPNIHWLGQKRYDELPSYLAGWDLGLMPFALNDATRFISPTKTPEFLAAGLGVVSTAIRDVVRPYGELGLVRIAEGPEDFARYAAELLEQPRTPWLRKVDAFLARNSWDLTWQQMRSEIEKVLTRRFLNLSHPKGAESERARV
jgi:hypothetical protein